MTLPLVASTPIVEESERGRHLLDLLDTIPEDVRLVYILPCLSPQTLVWLNKANYILYHNFVRSQISSNRTERFPLGRYETYVRHMIRIDASFVLNQLLIERELSWKRRMNYYYNGKKFDTYFHFISHYSIDQNSSRCRKAIQIAACKALGKKWYKRTRTKSSRWSN